MNRTVFERNAPRAALLDESLRDSRLASWWIDDTPGRRFPRARGALRADLAIVGAGYTGLWTAIRAKERDPDRRVIVVEARTVGWAASGRNGGFVEHSLTHGTANGERRWPDELAQLDKLGHENLDGIEATVDRYAMDVDFERTGTLSVAIEPHQIEWLAGPSTPDDIALDQTQAQAEVNSPTYLAARWATRSTALVHPAKLTAELARVADELGVIILEGSPVLGLGRDGTDQVLRLADATITAPHIALATNVFPSLLKRNRLMTVPVYDYVLATEPLGAAHMESIGWRHRQGIADLANQFHYYRLSSDNRIVFGGYDAIYHAGGRIRSQYEDRPTSYRTLASHFFTTFPQLEGVRFTHRWAGAIDTSTRFCAFFGTARGGRVSYAAGFTGLGVGAARFAADVMLDQLAGVATERTELRMVRERPLPFPPEPAASIGINLTRASLDRADHNAGRRNLLLKALDAAGLGFDS